MTRPRDHFLAVAHEALELAHELRAEPRLKRLAELLALMAREMATQAHHLANAQDKLRLPPVLFEDDPDESPTHPSRAA